MIVDLTVSSLLRSVWLSIHHRCCFARLWGECDGKCRGRLLSYFRVFFIYYYIMNLTTFLCVNWEAKNTQKIPILSFIRLTAKTVVLIFDSQPYSQLRFKLFWPLSHTVIREQTMQVGSFEGVLSSIVSCFILNLLFNSYKRDLEMMDAWIDNFVLH